MFFRFAGFELDQDRMELRRAGGEALKLRPKSFTMLRLFANNPGRVLSKEELMGAVWPDVYVGEDNLFQCIRELRTALGDEDRQLVKLVSGRGYLFDAEVSAEPQCPPPALGETPALVPADPAPAAPRVGIRRPFGLGGRRALAALVGLCAILVLAVAAAIFAPGSLFARKVPVIAVMPMVETHDDGQAAGMAAGVTNQLIDGLAKIDTMQVVVAPGARADFVVTSELQKTGQAWTLRARMIRRATQEVAWTGSVSVDAKDLDEPLQQSRLAAGIGYPLALHLNELLDQDTRPAVAGDGGKVVIEQAMAMINQTSKERFIEAQRMLETALAADHDNVDLEVALAGLRMRGVQMVWYSPEQSIAAKQAAKTLLERAVRARPDHIPVLEAYCRFLNANTDFVESLVACARTLRQDPWDGQALYLMGLGQMQLGRFEDALESFKQAERFDTPAVSRWTFPLGVGVIYLLMGRSDDAVPWLQKSIAITAASGRSYMLLAAAYQQQGRPAEAKALMDQSLALRPGSNAANVSIVSKNSSPAFAAACDRILQALVAAGLPDH